MIQIIRGVYGHYIDGHVVPKDKNSEPFALAPEREKCLVRIGVAKYVDNPVDDAKPDIAEELLDLPDGVESIPKYSTDMKVDELRGIAKLMGLTFPVGTTKAEMVAQMDAFLDEHMEESEDDADMPPEDIEDAPAFDAAEAVQ